MDRACSVVPAEHVVTVIGRGHREFLTEYENENMPGLVLEQPDNLGTAPGVFWALAYVLAVNPEATVVLLPSDHYAHPEALFCSHIASAGELAEKYRETGSFLSVRFPTAQRPTMGGSPLARHGQTGAAP